MPAADGASTAPAAGAAAPASVPPAAGGSTSPAGGGAESKSTTPGFDDLFGPTPSGNAGGASATPPAGGANTTPPVGGAESTDPFGKSAAILHENGGLASENDRDWVDNTGHYSTRARLVAFPEGHVRLLKENGRTTTVPLARLSQADLEFVNRQASDQQALQIAEAEHPEAPVGTPLAAN